MKAQIVIKESVIVFLPLCTTYNGHHWEDHPNGQAQVYI